MDVNKWRIVKSQLHGGAWVVFGPGYTIRTAFKGNNFRHCVSALPYLQRINDNSRKLRRGR